MFIFYPGINNIKFSFEEYFQEAKTVPSGLTEDFSSANTSRLSQVTNIHIWLFPIQIWIAITFFFTIDLALTGIPVSAKSIRKIIITIQIWFGLSNFRKYIYV